MAMADGMIFERMVEDLHSKGTSESDIARLREQWSKAPHNKSLPCPCCMLKGKTGALVPLPADDHGVESVRCADCDTHYELS